MAPWTGEDDQKSQVRKLVKRLLQKPKGAPRGPTGFAVEAIKQLGFDPESKGQIRSFISKGAADGSSLIPDEHQYAVVEVPSVTFTAPNPGNADHVLDHLKFCPRLRLWVPTILCLFMIHQVISFSGLQILQY